MADHQCDGMESHDSHTVSEVKIEIDVAEDESLFWNTEVETQGKTHDCVEDITTDTHLEINTSNPLAADTATDPVNIVNCKQWIKTEPDDVLHQFQSEPVDKSERKLNITDIKKEPVMANKDNAVQVKSEEDCTCDDKSNAAFDVNSSIKTERTSDNKDATFADSANIKMENPFHDKSDAEFVVDTSVKTEKTKFDKSDADFPSMSTSIKAEKTFDDRCDDAVTEDTSIKTKKSSSVFVKIEVMTVVMETETYDADTSFTKDKGTPLDDAQKHGEPSSATCQVPGSDQPTTSDKTALGKTHDCAEDITTDTHPLAADTATDPINMVDCKQWIQTEPDDVLHQFQSEPVDKSERKRNNKCYSCDVCTKTFKCTYNLKKHMLVHTNERPFVCDVCSKTFKRTADLKQHIIVHTDERSFACDVCSKTFNRATNLKQHMLVHTSERTVACDVCSMTFKHASKVKKHMLVHTVEKCFACSECGKTFKRANGLTVHMLVHTDERPFACDVCSKAFKRASHLKQHMSSHTDEKPFICDVCSKTFNRADNLKQHKLVHIDLRPFFVMCEVKPIKVQRN